VRIDLVVGRRVCRACGYRGITLICSEVTPGHIDCAELAGADALVVSSGRSFIADQGS
jgi:hypothetical protein